MAGKNATCGLGLAWHTRDHVASLWPTLWRCRTMRSRSRAYRVNPFLPALIQELQFLGDLDPINK